MFSGTGIGIVSVVLSAIKATRLAETPRGGQIFATDLGRYRYPVPLLHTILTTMHSICNTASVPQHKF